MDRKDEIKQELEEISPLLAKLKKDNPFEVPANYFERLPDQIMEQAKLTPVERPVPQISWLDRLIASFAFMLRPQVAFGLLCLVALTWTSLYLWNNPTETPGLATTSEEMLIENYIAANIDDFDTEILAEVALEEEGLEDWMMTDDEEMDEALMDEILDELEGIDIEDLL